MSYTYQNWKWIEDKEVAVYENGAIVITDNGGEVNFKSATEACRQLKNIIQWLEEEVLGERV
jgi:hypothetical protein